MLLFGVWASGDYTGREQAAKGHPPPSCYRPSTRCRKTWPRAREKSGHWVQNCYHRKQSRGDACGGPSRVVGLNPWASKTGTNVWFIWRTLCPRGLFSVPAPPFRGQASGGVLLRGVGSPGAPSACLLEGHRLKTTCLHPRGSAFAPWLQRDEPDRPDRYRWSSIVLGPSAADMLSCAQGTDGGSG